MFDETIHAKARRVLEACRAAGVMLVTAESCTGGLVAGALTEIAGSSDVVDRGFVTYSNEAKSEAWSISPPHKPARTSSTRCADSATSAVTPSGLRRSKWRST